MAGELEPDDLSLPTLTILSFYDSFSSVECSNHKSTGHSGGVEKHPAAQSHCSTYLCCTVHYKQIKKSLETLA